MIKARAQVTTGTGKLRRSSRRTGWDVEPEGHGLGGGTLTIEAQLFNEHLGQGVDPKELAGEIELVTRLLRDGKSPTEVLSGLTPADEAADLRRSLRLAAVVFGGRRLLDEADSTNDPG